MEKCGGGGDKVGKEVSCDTRKIDFEYGWDLIGGVADKLAGKGGERLGEKEKKKKKERKTSKGRDGHVFYTCATVHLFFASIFGGIITKMSLFFGVLCLFSFFFLFFFLFPSLVVVTLVLFLL
ncbi:hypothetical protein BKA57DRAFT_211775 [Linnemannia elongata]|nr:hypothetical protein BKA57DRAFT_211775 [Linnemannia elongata]